MTEAFCRFKPVPLELRGQTILLEIEGAGIERIRELVKEHEKSRYRIQLENADKRSLSQSDRFHAMARALMANGYTMDEAKALLKHEGGVVIQFGPDFKPPTRAGQFVELYGEIEFQVSTAKYTKAEMTRLMEKAEYFLANAGIQWYD